MIGLIDVDQTGFPNLALMKLSAFYKSMGKETALLSPDDLLLGYNLFFDYEELIGACVFKENGDTAKKLEKEFEAAMGGTGTDNPANLPYEIEHIRPDYSLYGLKDTAMGFITRGCPRNCPFCIVSGKEGERSSRVSRLSEWRSDEREIRLLDPNLLACDEHEDILRELSESGALVNFVQGLDARLLTPENMSILDSIHISRIHFSWDNPREGEIIKANLSKFNEAVHLDIRQKSVYVLVNYWSTHEEDLARVYWLRDNGYTPYVMLYDKSHAPKRARDLQRWVNNKRIFKTVRRFEDYKASMPSHPTRSIQIVKYAEETELSFAPYEEALSC